MKHIAQQDGQTWSTQWQCCNIRLTNQSCAFWQREMKCFDWLSANRTVTWPMSFIFSVLETLGFTYSRASFIMFKVIKQNSNHSTQTTWYWYRQNHSATHKHNHANFWQIFQGSAQQHASSFNFIIMNNNQQTASKINHGKEALSSCNIK